MAILNEKVACNVWKDKMVQIVYSYETDEALNDGLSLEDIKSKFEKTKILYYVVDEETNTKTVVEEEISSAPDVDEVRLLRTTCKKIVDRATGETKYAVRAALRYVPAGEEESH